MQLRERVSVTGWKKGLPRGPPLRRRERGLLVRAWGGGFPEEDCQLRGPLRCPPTRPVPPCHAQNIPMAQSLVCLPQWSGQAGSPPCPRLSAQHQGRCGQWIQMVGVPSECVQAPRQKHLGSGCGSGIYTQNESGRFLESPVPCLEKVGDAAVSPSR